MSMIEKSIKSITKPQNESNEMKGGVRRRHDDIIQLNAENGCQCMSSTGAVTACTRIAKAERRINHNRKKMEVDMKRLAASASLASYKNKCEYDG